MTIKINDDLIKQWEPKIQKLLFNTFVYGWDKEDLEQELRIAIIKAAKGFNADRGVLFHTYLHTAMVNVLRTLISKAQKRLITDSLDEVRIDTEMPSLHIVRALSDSLNLEDEVTLKTLIENTELTKQETQFLILRLEGLTMEEISFELGDSAYKIRQSLQGKFKGMFHGQEA